MLSLWRNFKFEHTKQWCKDQTVDWIGHERFFLVIFTVHVTVTADCNCYRSVNWLTVIKMYYIDLKKLILAVYTCKNVCTLCGTVFERIMFSTWPSVCPLCPFARPLTKLVNTIFWKRKKTILLQTSISGLRGNSMKRSTVGSAGQSSRSGHTRPKTDLKAWRRHHSRPRWVK